MSEAKESAVAADNGNAAVRFVDSHLKAGRGDKTAFLEADGRGRRLTYGELSEQSDRMAALFERHGIQPEQRALMLVLDTVEFPVIFWGSLKAGVIPVPLNTLLSGEVYAAIALDSRASALFVSAPLLEEARKALKAVPDLKVFLIGGDAETEGVLDFQAELDASAPRPALERRSRRLRVLALLVRLDRAAEGRPSRSRLARCDRRHLRLAGARHRRGRYRPLRRQAVLRLRPRQRHDLSDERRRDDHPVGRPADAGQRAAMSFAIIDRPSSAACRPSMPRMLAKMTRAPGRRRPAAPLHFGRRGAAGACRQALARTGRQRHPRRRRLDRNAAHLPVQRARTTSSTARRDARFPATICGSSTSMARRSAPARSANCWSAAHVGRRQLLEPARQEPRHLRRRMDLYRRQI